MGFHGELLACICFKLISDAVVVSGGHTCVLILHPSICLCFLPQLPPTVPPSEWNNMKSDPVENDCVYLRRCDTLCSGHFIIIKTYFSREFKINALKMTYWRSDENLFVVSFNCLFRIPWALGLLCCILVILILISRCSFYCRRLTEVLFHIKRPETLYASIQTQMWMLWSVHCKRFNLILYFIWKACIMFSNYFTYISEMCLEKWCLSLWQNQTL